VGRRRHGIIFAECARALLYGETTEGETNSVSYDITPCDKSYSCRIQDLEYGVSDSVRRFSLDFDLLEFIQCYFCIAPDDDMLCLMEIKG
jgi:hypothetical protein